MIRLTKDDINDRLSSHGIRLVGEYLNTSTKTDFECSSDHKFNAKPNNILTRLRCPVCNDNKIPYTVDEINKKLAEREIELVGSYLGYKINNTFVGKKCYHEWQATPKNVLKQTNCPQCNIEKQTLTMDDINHRLSDDGIKAIGIYGGMNVKMLFVCRDGHEFKSTPANITTRKTCPVCARSGFKRDKISYGYILSFGDFIKYGITNCLSQRLYTHRKNNGEFQLMKTIEFSNGNLAIEWEINIKRVHGGCFVDKSRCPDGFTETLPIDKLKEVMEG